MLQQDDRRRFPRMSTGPEYRVSFRDPAGTGVEAQVKNLSAGGCGMEVPMAGAAGLELGSHVDHIYLDHAHLPFVPLEGVVVRILGKLPGKTSGYVLVGLEFTAISAHVRKLIQHHVAEALG